MDIKYLIIVAALINFLLGLVVFRKPKKSRADISFIIFIWFTTVWAAAFFFYEHPFFLNSLIWIKIVYFLVFGIVGSLFYFSFVFPSGEQKPPKIVLIIYSIIAFPFIWTLFFTDLFVVQVIQESWGYQTVIGPIYIPLTFYFIPVIIWCFSNFFKNYRRAKGIHKIQLRYMFVGLGLFVGPTLVVDAFIPLLTGQSRCFWLSPVFSFFFIGCTAYAILRYRLMDISLVVRTGLVYLLSTVILIAGVLGAIYFFSSLVGYTPNIKLVMIGSLAMSVLLLIFIPLKDFLLKIANKYFFKTVYTTQETLKSIREKAATIIELDKLIKEIVDTIKKAFGLSSIAFLLKEKEVFIVEENIGFEVEDIFALTKEEFLFTSLEEKRKALILEEIEGKPENLKEKMEEMEVSLILPLFSKKELSGLVLLGPKVAHEAYTKEDLELLETLGSQVAIAIENAKLYHQVQDLSQNLQKKVDEQTRKIRNAYELEKKAHKELKRLDEVKSQFIMATQHHLRTPLTAMKGYVSMILEGDFGEVSPKTKEKLKGFQSSIERLINLVNEFLDISQIQLGKGILNLKKTKIDDLISEIVEELKPEAQRKNLYFRFEKPSSLPEIKADKEKLREAIFDIVDNAIRYTQRGGVEVKLNINPPAGGQRLNIIVKDTGIGLEKEEKKRLFGEIFARGKKAKEVYTLGRGIGLFIARNIIEAHRGKVWAESGGRNRGSTFFIEIPTG